MKRYLVEQVHNGNVKFRIIISGVGCAGEAIETALRHAPFSCGRWRATET